MLSNRTTSLATGITDLFLGQVSLPDPSSEVGMDGSSSSAVAVNDGRPRFRVTVGGSLFSCTSASLMIAVNPTRSNYSRFGWFFCSSCVDNITIIDHSSQEYAPLPLCTLMVNLV